MLFIHYGTREKANVSTIKPKRIGTQDYMYLCSSTLLQSSTEYIVMSYCDRPLINFFPLYLFVFEVVLDFFHYVTHRLSHTFYRFHKTHHHHTQPRLLNTFWHHPIDLFFIECIPTMIAFYIVRGSSFWMQSALVYKSFIEISGHSGKRVAPSSCFPLCVWLPRSLGIELYTENHDRHHSSSMCNFSKRFSLWDKIFGTFVGRYYNER